MKIKQIITLVVGVISVALSPIIWAAPHGGGGGFGGAGFGGGHPGGGAVSRGGGVGFGAPGHGGEFGFGGARFSPGSPRFSGAGPRFYSYGARSSYRQPVYSGRTSRAVTSSVRAGTASNRRFDRVGSASRSSRASGQRGLNGRTDHIFARHDANWHRDWDRRHPHFSHGHFFVFDDGYWFGLDAGIYPWDYLPYYAYDYDPYNYYTDVDPNYGTAPVYNGVPVANTTVQAAQTRLAQFGYYTGPVDGIFGPATRDALAKYQIAKQLNVTGSLSPETLQSLGLPRVTPS